MRSMQRGGGLRANDGPAVTCNAETKSQCGEQDFRNQVTITAEPYCNHSRNLRLKARPAHALIPICTSNSPTLRRVRLSHVRLVT